MTRARIVKTNFTAGEVSTDLLGRGDLRAYENGAARLTNLFIHPTGGVTRRAGLYHIDTVPGPGRLVPFEFNTEETYLLVFTDRLVSVYRGGLKRAEIVSPWHLSELDQIAWTQSADTLLVCHPERPPQRITRTSDTSWSIDDWAYITDGDALLTPFFRFEPPEVTLTASATTGSITITSSAPFFLPGHEGARLTLIGKQVSVTSVSSATAVTAQVEEPLSTTAATKDWAEQAFSDARGYPICAAFHQDRLVIGGSRDLPNRLWLSRSGDLFNFDLGEGLDDEAIEFAILSDQVNAIRALFSGRHLQVFTSGGEWVVTGDPLTPTTLQVRRQTRIGMPVDRWVPPVDVDGATLFCARHGSEIREFLFTDLEQAYRSNDLALISRHLVTRPASLAFDQRRRLLFVAMGDGRLATLTVYRSEEVAAWTGHETDGDILSVVIVGDEVFVLTARNGTHAIEIFDDTAAMDAALSGSGETPSAVWSGLDHLEGRIVAVKADGVVRADAVVSGGKITIDPPAFAVEIGLPFTHVVEPLPPSALGQAGSARAYRLIEATFRLRETAALRADFGQGLRDLPLRSLAPGAVLDQTPPSVTGDKRVRGYGWQRDFSKPPWRIEQSAPLPFTLLSATLEMKVNS